MNEPIIGINHFIDIYIFIQAILFLSLSLSLSADKSFAMELIDFFIQIWIWNEKEFAITVLNTEIIDNGENFTWRNEKCRILLYSYMTNKSDIKFYTTLTIIL